MPADAHIQEDDRLASLDSYDVLDTPCEEAYDRITRLTRRIFGVSMSTISLLDGHRQWFKSRQGLSPCETPRGPAICNVAIRGAEPLVIPDTLADERFKDNPYVVGEPHIRFYAGAPLRTPEGQTIGTLCAMDTVPRDFDRTQVEVLTDLASMVMSELELRKLASTDGLTGAMSRRAFREEAARAIALAVRHGHDLAGVVLDLDHFKAVNDTHGHPAGDRVLAQTVATCRACLRGSDLLGRIGGEEFAILLPHTSRDAALEVAEKIRTAIAQQAIVGASGPIHTTASFGIALFDPSITGIDGLIERADTALYAAKAAGRNRCVEWQGRGDIQPIKQHRVFKAGRITFNRGRSSIDCTIRGLSEAGAALDVCNSADVPKRFKLHVEPDGWNRHCRIVSSREKRLSVAFR